MRLLGISGSVRAASSNSRLLSAASGCVPDDVVFEIADCLEQLPHFNPDLNPNDIPVVAAWVAQIKAADGLIISTPEYAGGYPGVLKDALDWLVQTDAHIEKPFMMLHASKRSFTARDTLAKVMETMSGIQIHDANLTIHLVGNSDRVEVLRETHGEALRQSLTAFVQGIKQPPGAS